MLNNAALTAGAAQSAEMFAGPNKHSCAFATVAWMDGLPTAAAEKERRERGVLFLQRRRQTHTHRLLYALSEEWEGLLLITAYNGELDCSLMHCTLGPKQGAA
jgi:hypothetical protein